MRDLDFYRRLRLIRRAEETVRERYRENEMKTPVHLSIGQEAVAVGVCAALRPEDQILATYRGHGVHLARTGDPNAFFAELYGRATGHAKGKAGSMHLAAPERGFLASSAVVGTTIPLALGVAFANKRARSDRVCAVLFGDGAIDEGVFWESINYASLAALPVIFVCEDNDLAIHTPASARHGYESIAAIVERFRCHVASSDSTDPALLCDLTAEAIRVHRETGRPGFLHFRCYRYLEHVGVEEDFDAGYRSRAEYERWVRRDPIALVRERILGAGIARATLDAIDHDIDAAIGAAVERARNAPFPEPRELLEDVWA